MLKALSDGKDCDIALSFLLSCHTWDSYYDMYTIMVEGVSVVYSDTRRVAVK